MITLKIPTLVTGVLTLSTLTLSLTFPAISYADPPYYPDLVLPGNRWLVTSYWDKYTNHPVAGYQILCFRKVTTDSNHVAYEWFAEPYPAWKGKAVQEGDQVQMYGGYLSHRGSSADWEINGRDTGAGTWKDWQYPHSAPPFGNIYIFANAEFQRIGYCFEPWPSNTSNSNAAEFNEELGNATADVDLWQVPGSYFQKAPEVKAVVKKILNAKNVMPTK